MTQAVHNPLTWTIIGGWVISFPIFWLKVISMLLWIYLFLELFDFLTWFLSARKKWIVSSKIWSEWIIKKVLKISLILLMIFVISWLKFVWLVHNDIFWLVPIFFLWIFIFIEIISIFENLSVIFWDSKEGQIFKFLSMLSNKIFNISFEKLKEKTEEKIENKFNNIIK